MDGPNKRKRKRRLSEAQSEDSRYKSQIVPSIDGLGLIDSVNESRQPVEISVQRSLSQSLDMAVEGRVILEDDTLTLDVTDAPGQISQTTHFLEGSILEILRFEDIADIMTFVLLKVAKIRIQVGRSGFQIINIGTITNTAEIQKYTENDLAKKPFKKAIERIMKSGAGSY
jgi:hypothetical protein